MAAKLVLTEGGMKEYRAVHQRISYRYYDPLPAQKLLSFGSGQPGKPPPAEERHGGNGFRPG